MVNFYFENQDYEEINPNSYKMLSLESYTPLQRKTRHVKELQTVSDYKKVIKFE